MLESILQPAILLLFRRELSRSSWKEVFHPYKHLYSKAVNEHVKLFLQGDYFKDLVRDVVGVTSFRLTHEIVRFSSGNFTLIHDSEKRKGGVDFILNVSEHVPEHGGHVQYLSSKEELLKVFAKANSLTFVNRNSRTFSYVKYVTKKQKSLMYVWGTIYTK